MTKLINKLGDGNIQRQFSNLSPTHISAILYFQYINFVSTHLIIIKKATLSYPKKATL